MWSIQLQFTKTFGLTFAFWLTLVGFQWVVLLIFNRGDRIKPWVLRKFKD